MVEAIKQICEKTGQHVPQSYGEFCRCIFESLALRYRQIFTWLKEFADFDLNVLHIIGGGSLNQYLNQFTANSCGVTVLGWSSGRYSHRQHHAPGKGIRLGQGYLGNATDHRQLAGAEEIRATGQGGLGCGLREVFKGKRVKK